MTQLQTPDQKTAGRRLSELDDAERYRCFDDLQVSMPGVWDSMKLDFDDESVVVVPSISIERTTTGSGTVMQAMEERAMFLLLLLRQPRLQMIYVTSQPISESIIEYYLGLLPGVIPSHARSRLTLVAVGDASPVPLSAKLLARPRLLREIRSLIPNPSRCHLIPYNTTPMERDVALSLSIPMYGADPRLADLGSKTGCKRMFDELGVRCPVGAEDLHTLDDIVAGVQSMRVRRPSLRQAIVKLNEGVSGAGNAMVDFGDLPAPGSPDEAAVIKERLLAMQPEDEKLAVDVYLAAFEKHGGIVEERITGVTLTSPSVPMRALPDGTVELLSTHDQVLGGASGQKYLGCIFPANPDYAAAIAEPAMVIGKHLATLGVLGRFAVDFVVVQDDSGAWTPYAIELNLRKGGTTHPFLTLQFLTDGSYDGARGVFLTPGGSPKYLVATDHFEDDRLKVLTTAELFDIVVRHGLHFDQSRRTGVVFHMISCLTECGRVGLTAVGDSPEDAWRIYEEAQSVVLQEAAEALEEGCVVAVS
jgi:PGM1 C-terminal domain